MMQWRVSGGVFLNVAFSGGLCRLAAWHLPGGPVGPPAKWAATSSGADSMGHGGAPAPHFYKWPGTGAP